MKPNFVEKKSFENDISIFHLISKSHTNMCPQYLELVTHITVLSYNHNIYMQMPQFNTKINAPELYTFKLLGKNVSE